MQISSSFLSIPAGGVSRRDGAFDGARPSVRPVESVDDSTARETTRLRPRASALSLEDSFADSLQNLPPKSRNALQSYLSNGPSMQERLGVELAGVDVFV